MDPNEVLCLGLHHFRLLPQLYIVRILPLNKKPLVPASKPDHLAPEGPPEIQHPLNLSYHLKWAKALLASAILCVSSLFLMEEPSFFEAARNSAASFSAMERPLLCLL
jgi:hypothetical protein